MIAAKRTRVAAGQSDVKIESGNACWIYSILVTSTGSAGTVTVENDAGTEEFIIAVEANATFELSVAFIADAGLQITTDANTQCTVFHSHPGR